jgi:hypothetical protein
VDDDKVRYYLWNGGPVSTENGVTHIAPSVTKEQIPGSFAVCPECLANLLKDD